MKKSILILTATAVCLPLLAQAEGDKPERKRERKGMPEAIIKRFDKDGDGKLNEEERKAMREAREARHKEMLEKYDTDGDGKLSKDEREAAMKEWKDKLLQEFDADGDGELSEEERKNAHKTLQERGEHAPFFGHQKRDRKRKHKDGDKPEGDDNF